MENVVEPEELVDNVVAVVELMLAVPSLSLRHTHMPVSSLPACRNGHHRVVEMLLAAGGNKETLSNNGWSHSLIRQLNISAQPARFSAQIQIFGLQGTGKVRQGHSINWHRRNSPNRVGFESNIK